MRRWSIVFMLVILFGCADIPPPAALTVTRHSTVTPHRPARPRPPLTRAQQAAFDRWVARVLLERWILTLPGMQQDGYPRAWHPCGGGKFPPCYRVGTESATAGLYRAFNASGCAGRGCYGKWQFDPLTWDALARRMGRPELVGRYFGIKNGDQDEVAAAGWDHGNGCQHWSACGSA